MKVLVAAFLVGYLFGGCRSKPREPKGQWILAGYDAEKGYVFRKDGVQYIAKCTYLKVVYQQIAGQKKDDPQRIYEQFAPKQDECTFVLPHMHAAIPLVDYGNDVLELVPEESGGDATRSAQFTILKAN